MVAEPGESMHVPVIDLSAGSESELATRVGDALQTAGFFSIIGHAVPSAVFDAAFEVSGRFFSMPEPIKSRWHVNQSRHKHGFDPIGWQSLDVGQPPDLKESFYIGVERTQDHPLVRLGIPTQGPNQWPDESLIPGFQSTCNTYADAMRALALRLMHLFGISLGLPAGHFDRFMRDPTCTPRLLHYPPQPATAASGQIGCGAHTDWGALTLLAQDDAGGLQVQTPEGGWIDIAPVPCGLVVNAGDMMQRWTNDRWRSTMHRVINRHSGRDRYSIAYFFDLDHFASIEPLPGCISAERPARYAPITAGEHLIEMYRRTTLAG
jgi:isopenicillin N synthase-like dioxygenase